MKQLTPDELGNWINQMSEYLLGYREGSYSDMLSKAVELRNIEKFYNRQQGVQELFEAIHNLHYLAEDIEVNPNITIEHDKEAQLKLRRNDDKSRVL